MNKFNKRRDINSMVSMMGKVKNPTDDTVANLKSIEDVLAAGESSGSGGVTDAIMSSGGVTAPTYEGDGSKEKGSTGPYNLSDEQVKNLKDRKAAKAELKNVNSGSIVAKMGIKRKVKKAVEANNYSTSNDENAGDVPDDGYSKAGKLEILKEIDAQDAADKKRIETEKWRAENLDDQGRLKPTL